MNRRPSDPLVSVIVPVFNCENYLPGCLDSLKAQTLQDIEIILVDDGSTDSSGSLCDSCASGDERFRVVHQENGGVSAARNAGLSHAQGRYVMFVDSDDTVEPDFCKTPYLLAQQYDADVVVFRFNLWSSDPLIIGGPAEQYSGLKTPEEALRLFEFADVYIWNKLYKRELFEDIRFPDVSRYEEHGVSHKLLHAANKVYFSDEVLYHYYVRNAGLSAGFTLQSEIDRYRLVQLQTEDFRAWGLDDLAAEREMRAAIRYLVKVGENGPYTEDSKAVFGRKTKDLPYFTKKENLLHKLFCLSSKLFDLACELGKKRLTE